MIGLGKLTPINDEGDFEIGSPIVTLEGFEIMMPTEQRCPSCQQTFMGSDAIGDVCDRCKAIEGGHKVKGCPLCRGRGWVIDEVTGEALAMNVDDGE